MRRVLGFRCGTGRHQPSAVLVAARSFREVRVLGWSGPRVRSRSARVRSCSPIASVARPVGPVGGGEVVPGVQDVGVVRAQDPLAVGEVALVQRDRLGGPARLPVGLGEVVPGAQGAGVVRAQDPFLVLARSRARYVAHRVTSPYDLPLEGRVGEALEFGIGDPLDALDLILAGAWHYERPLGSEHSAATGR
jgi:hypothetical protein